MNSRALATDKRGAEELARVKLQLDKANIAEEECQNKLWVRCVHVGVRVHVDWVLPDVDVLARTSDGRWAGVRCLGLVEAQLLCRIA